MMYRTVKPPPKVNPNIKLGVPSPQKPRHMEPPPVISEMDFEAAVRAEMEKLEQDLMRQIPPSHDIIRADGGPRNIPHSMMPEERDLEPDYSEMYRAPVSPRAKGGGISNLYGPSDDRQNMKAAKAAAYSHQVRNIPT
jgi:hypothetical protein